MIGDLYVFNEMDKLFHVLVEKTIDKFTAFRQDLFPKLVLYGVVINSEAVESLSRSLNRPLCLKVLLFADKS